MKQEKQSAPEKGHEEQKAFYKQPKHSPDQRSKPIVTEALMEERMLVGPRNITLSGAEHFVMDIDTRVAKPSEYGVDEMRAGVLSTKNKTI